MDSSNPRRCFPPRCCGRGWRPLHPGGTGGQDDAAEGEPAVFATAGTPLGFPASSGNSRRRCLSPFPCLRWVRLPLRRYNHKARPQPRNVCLWIATSISGAADGERPGTFHDLVTLNLREGLKVEGTNVSVLIELDASDGGAKRTLFSGMSPRPFARPGGSGACGIRRGGGSGEARKPRGFCRR